jgi:hypothetical protein
VLKVSIYGGNAFIQNNTLLKPLTYCMSTLKQVSNYQNIHTTQFLFSYAPLKWKVLLQRSLHPEIGMTIEQENDKYVALKRFVCVFLHVHFEGMGH